MRTSSPAGEFSIQNRNKYIYVIIHFLKNFALICSECVNGYMIRTVDYRGLTQVKGDRSDTTHKIIVYITASHVTICEHMYKAFSIIRRNGKF